jgi:hypothetical protein
MSQIVTGAYDYLHIDEKELKGAFRTRSRHPVAK